MKLALYIILYGGLGFSFWMLYEVVKYTQGERIKRYYGRYMALLEAEKLDKQLRQARLLKQLEANRVVEVECEEVPFDDVIYTNERPTRTPNTIVLEINEKSLLNE